MGGGLLGGTGTDAGLVGAWDMGSFEGPELLRRRTLFWCDVEGQRDNEPTGTKMKREQQVASCLPPAGTCCSDFLVGAMPGSCAEVFSPISEFVCTATPLTSFPYL